jgi:hypothetical protein
MNVFRNIISVVAGLVANMILILIIEWLGSRVFTVPRLKSQEEYFEFIASAPAGFHLLFLLAYAAGSYGGGIVAARIAYDNKITRAMTVGGIAMGLGLFNLYSMHHPMWVILCSLLAFLPFSYMGGKAGLSMSKKAA